MKMNDGGLLLIVVAGLCGCCLLPEAAGYSLYPSNYHHNDVGGQTISEMYSPAVVGAVGVALLICALVIIFGCADFCRKEVGFKDFENEDSFNHEPVVPESPPSAFTMYPPVENTPESAAATTTNVYFEPLPDVAMQLRQKQQHMVNSAQLRPKVLQESARNRAASEDSIEEAIQRDSVQEKMKLQNILTNTRNQLPRSQLQYIKELGNGWFGKVLQGEGHQILPGHRKTKVVIQMLKEDAAAHEQLAFLQEGTPFRDVDHPNVLKLLGQCVETPPFLTVVELCPFGDVKMYLRSHKIAMESFNEKGLLLKFACDMAAGLQALHQQGFVHRDFATRNCLLASDLSVKVGDYGLSEEVFKEDYYFDENGDALPIRWLAPEVISVADDNSVLLRRITKESNIWSYGVTLWETLLFGSLPYSDLSNEHVLRLVIKERSIKLPKPDVPVSHIDRIYQLMRLCWSEPHLRPSLRELRIMLLHLLSRKDIVDTSSFDQKWSQLMPRQPAQITRVPDSSGASQPMSNGSIQTVAASGASPAQAPPARPAGFQEAFEQMHAAPGTPSLHEEIAQVNSKSYQSMAEQTTSPINELSLDAEFSAANMADMHEKSTDALIDNDISLDQELAAAQTSETESALGEHFLMTSSEKQDDSMPEAEHIEVERHVDLDKSAEEDDIVIIDHESESLQEDEAGEQTIEIGGQGTEDASPAKTGTGDKSVELSPGDKSVELSPNDKSVELSPGDKSVELSPGDKSVELSPGDKSVELSPGDKSVELSDKSEELSPSEGSTVDISVNISGSQSAEAEVSDVSGTDQLLGDKLPTDVPARTDPNDQPPAAVTDGLLTVQQPANTTDVSASDLSSGEHPEFMTSTPKKDSQEDDSTDMFMSAIQENTTTGTDSMFQSAISENVPESRSTSESLSQSSSTSTSHYQTAHSKLAGQQSLDLSLSYEERSIMAEDKFAAILQTVPMMSFEGDDSISMDRSAEDEVFSVSRLTTVSMDGPEAGDATLTETGQGEGSEDPLVEKDEKNREKDGVKNTEEAVNDEEKNAEQTDEQESEDKDTDVDTSPKGTNAQESGEKDKADRSAEDDHKSEEKEQEIQAAGDNAVAGDS